MAILFIGDSLSIGTQGAMPAAAAAAGVPAPDLRLPGKPGGRRAVDVPPALARTWRDEVAPGMVWIQLGTNDAAGGPDDLTRGWIAFDRLVREAVSWGVPVWIATLPPEKNREAAIATWNAAILKLADEAGARVVDLAPVLSLADLADGVHPSGAGYVRLARRWIEGPGFSVSTPSTAAAAGTGLGVLLLLLVAYYWSRKP